MVDSINVKGCKHGRRSSTLKGTKHGRHQRSLGTKHGGEHQLIYRGGQQMIHNARCYNKKKSGVQLNVLRTTVRPFGKTARPLT